MKLLLFDYKSHFVNLNELNDTEFNASLTDDVVNQLTGSSKDPDIFVINIWESWCKPCIKEIPELNKLMGHFGDRNILFIALSSSSEDDCKKVLKANNIEFDFKTYFKRESLIKKIDSIYYNKAMDQIVVPQNIIINQKGKILLFLEGAKPENILKMKLFLEETEK